MSSNIGVLLSVIGEAQHNETSNDDNQYQRAGKEKKLFTIKNNRAQKKDSEEAGPANQKEHHLDPQLCGQLCKKFAGGKHFRASLVAGQGVTGEGFEGFAGHRDLFG